MKLEELKKKVRETKLTEDIVNHWICGEIWGVDYENPEYIESVFCEGLRHGVEELQEWFGFTDFERYECDNWQEWHIIFRANGTYFRAWYAYSSWGDGHLAGLDEIVEVVPEEKTITVWREVKE